MALTLSPVELVAAAERSGSPGLLAHHETWERVPLGEIADVLNGFPFKSHAFNHDNDGIPLIRIRDVGRDASQTYYSGDYESQYLVQAGDMILGMDGEFRVAIWHGPPALLNQRVCKISIRNPRNYDLRFLLYVLPGYLDAIGAATSSVTVKHLSSRSVQQIPLPLPPLSEQLRIVEALDDHLSRLDAATEAVAGAKRRIKPFVTSVLDRAALGISLANHSGQAGVEGSRRLLSGFSSKRFDYDALPHLPEGWFWRRSSDVCEFISSGSTPKAHLMHPGSGEIPFLKVYNITQDGRVDFTNKPTYIDRETHNDQLKRSRVRPGDVLTNIVGPPLGKTAVVPEDHPEWNINQAIVAFRAGPEVQPEWLALVLRSPFVLSMLQKTAKATAGQFNVALSTCRELPLPIPPMDAQIALVAQSAELLEVSDRFAAQVASTSLRAQNLRQAVLRRAFTGNLVSQDSDDEPAAGLLDRIRTEREVQGVKPKRVARRPRKTVAPETLPPPSASSTPPPTASVQQELPL
ncbi:restriction endonuclease subunit S [Streptomyces tendae]|uniref:restriction endonuclease subunit S n=1 Tax=Streptomyces tendae TaxID=1932 RepID=UPI0036B2CA72